MNNGSLFSKVYKISVHIENGFIAPLTESGTIIVNGIHASCYTINSHYLAHLTMKPLIYWHKFNKMIGFNDVESNEIHNSRHLYLSFLKFTGLKSFADLLF
jgi:hypothetical protein